MTDRRRGLPGRSRTVSAADATAPEPHQRPGAPAESAARSRQTRPVDAPDLDLDRWLDASRAGQGLPPTIEDDATLLFADLVGVPVGARFRAEVLERGTRHPGDERIAERADPAGAA